MAAPRFTPSGKTATITSYRSPDFVPDQWMADRPADLVGAQPTGPTLGYPGPDQGYALTLAARLRPSVVCAAGEEVDDVIAGTVGIGLRRASLYGRAPVIHDLRIALTIWGFLDDSPPAELVDLRTPLFEGLADAHHYFERRELADSVPETTLRSTPAAIAEAYPARWRELLDR